jgi:membrane-associated phospholipid phosphatase
MIRRAWKFPTVAMRVATRFVTMFGGVLAFAEVERRMGEDHGLAFDEPMLAWLHRHRHPALTRAVVFVTELGSGPVLALISVAATGGLLLRGNPRAASYVAVTSAGAGLMNQGLKALYRRERPEVTLRLSQTTGFAFPSGHAMASAAIYGALAVVAFTRFPGIKWRALAACAALVGSIGATRAYLHVHYPSDILAGWGLGLTWPLWLHRPMLVRRFFA